MKRLMTPTYIARDKTPFTVEADCIAYERDNMPKILAGMSEAEVAAALDRSDPELADLIEYAGQRITALRRAAGDLKRARKNGNGDITNPADEAGAAPGRADGCGSEVKWKTHK